MRYFAANKEEHVKILSNQDPVIEQLSSAGSVAEVLETLAEQEEVKCVSFNF